MLTAGLLMGLGVIVALGLHALVAAPPRTMPTTLLARAPQPRLGHWRIRDVDADGRSTVRVIRVLDVDDQRPVVQAWCELRNALCSVSLASVQAAADVESGRPIDLARWWQATQRRSAAAKQRTEHRGDMSLAH
jgi:hypothetical protein